MQHNNTTKREKKLSEQFPIFLPKFECLKSMPILQTVLEILMNSYPSTIGSLVWMKIQLIMITPTPKFTPIDFGMES
jgi:hypothetical protein